MATAPDKIPDVLAAVDLGSNSFHMVVARYSHGQLTIVDRLREMVRLAAGLDDQGRLSKEASDRALGALQRFGQRLRDMRAKSVRVVGTNTLRKARRKAGFLERAREYLGHPIEIISGIEEARLIYSGVTHTMPLEPGRRFVIDIGGGSTECIVGEGYEPRILESLYLGCVALSQEYFPDGRVVAKRFDRAVIACEAEMEPMRAPFRAIGWEHAIGSSGSARAIGEAIRELDPAQQTITADGLAMLRERLVQAGNVRAAGITSINEERWVVFPGGLAIMIGIFKALGIDEMRVAEGALREGLLYDMIGRYTDEDARERSVKSFAARFHVDEQQAERVEKTAIDFLRQVEEAWGVKDPLAENAVRWAARLHEIGLDISHSSHHKHAAYLLEHADLPGFPREEQRLLACIVGNHRRKVSLDRTDDLLPPWHDKVFNLIVPLRLAVLLHRGRSRMPLPQIRLVPKPRSLELNFPRGWLKQHPLTLADLQQEVEFLKAVGFRLRVF
ncbi:MAG: Ppx/GppA phosphatase family protein [Steroidobacteraceae bacterium]|jgi:exopolyphosphatase/guanosine-5'-triphosphate,3'-diphosphate pyrophosphatase|nr:Ppx/GppA phosphatase family protein [Steroidobacteraceae bacterium]